ncbi:hypothetical protein T03_14709 [Trichinella britovi]|uniref:Uncharacterized protein n=1 Tax=Trichinella britovi TaxID=45882 RepID=A0A0V1AUS0_TRIBR|nr:hypothetical protein T03_14709 [Trichinella britovi]
MDVEMMDCVEKLLQISLFKGNKWTNNDTGEQERKKYWKD